MLGRLTLPLRLNFLLLLLCELTHYNYKTTKHHTYIPVSIILLCIHIIKLFQSYCFFAPEVRDVVYFQPVSHRVLWKRGNNKVRNLRGRRFQVRLFTWNNKIQSVTCSVQLALRKRCVVSHHLITDWKWKRHSTFYQQPVSELLVFICHSDSITVGY